MYYLLLWTHKLNMYYHELNSCRRRDLYYPYIDRLNLMIDIHEKAIRVIKEKYKPTLTVTYRRA